MPQMAPYDWLNLFIMFNSIYMILITFIYFMPLNMIHYSPLLYNNSFKFKW